MVYTKTTVDIAKLRFKHYSPPSPSSEALIRILYRRGKTYTQLADQFGVSASSIRRIIQRHI